MNSRIVLLGALLLSSLTGFAFAQDPLAAGAEPVAAPAISGQNERPSPIPEALLKMDPTDPKIITKAIEAAKSAFLSEDPKKIVKLMTPKCSKKWGAKLQKMKKEGQLALIGKCISYVESWYGSYAVLGEGFPMNSKRHVVILAKDKNTWKIAAIYDITNGFKGPIE